MVWRNFHLKTYLLQQKINFFGIRFRKLSLWGIKRRHEAIYVYNGLQFDGFWNESKTYDIFFNFYRIHSWERHWIFLLEWKILQQIKFDDGFSVLKQMPWNAFELIWNINSDENFYLTNFFFIKQKQNKKKRITKCEIICKALLIICFCFLCTSLLLVEVLET